MKISYPHILIVGSGQIGSRHLQSLKKINRQITISVIDNNSNSLNKSKKLFFNNLKNNQYDIHFYDSINFLKKNVDIAIISTNSDVRRKIIIKLIKLVKVNYLIIEKVAFQSLNDFNYIIRLLYKNNIKAWVNCPRRLDKNFQRLKKLLINENKINMIVSGNNWGLGTNSIHMVDIFSYLTNQLHFNVNSKKFHNKIYNSKRNGFFEIGGQLVIETKKGDQLILIDNMKKYYKFNFKIESDNYLFIIDQKNKIILFKNKKIQNFFKKKNYSIPLQSNITYKLINTILETSNCELTPLNESKLIHVPILKNFIEHFEKIKKCKFNKCPIT